MNIRHIIEADLATIPSETARTAVQYMWMRYLVQGRPVVDEELVVALGEVIAHVARVEYMPYMEAVEAVKEALAEMEAKRKRDELNRAWDEHRFRYGSDPIWTQQGGEE